MFRAGFSAGIAVGAAHDHTDSGTPGFIGLQRYDDLCTNLFRKLFMLLHQRADVVALSAVAPHAAESLRFSLVRYHFRYRGVIMKTVISFIHLTLRHRQVSVNVG